MTTQAYFFFSTASGLIMYATHEGIVNKIIDHG